MTANKVDPSIFGAELAALRRKCGMTQADLGRASNINPQYISLLENGKREAGLSTIVALAQALGYRLQQSYPTVMVEDNALKPPFKAEEEKNRKE